MRGGVRRVIGATALVVLAGCGADASSASSSGGPVQNDGHLTYCAGLGALGSATSGLQKRTMTVADAASAMADAADHFHNAATVDASTEPTISTAEQKLSDDVARFRVDLLNGTDPTTDSGAVAADVTSGQSC